ncbi:MAG: hypothetical protein ACREJ0_13465 [Geminicoccaceae bacterium]
MLGIGPKPEGAANVVPQVYGAPLQGALLAVLGISALVLLALLPATFGVGWLSSALIGLPLAIGGACGALMGYAVLSTRIEIAPDGIAIAAPGWRACPFPPVRQYRLEWTAVRAVRHRTELYRIGPLPWRLPLEVYAIETTAGLIPLGSYYLADLEPVLIDLAQRADRPWREDGEVEADLLRTLLLGAPPWPTVDRRRPA